MDASGKKRKEAWVYLRSEKAPSSRQACLTGGSRLPVVPDAVALTPNALAYIHCVKLFSKVP